MTCRGTLASTVVRMYPQPLLQSTALAVGLFVPKPTREVAYHDSYPV